MFNLADKLSAVANQMILPDLWQHEAVASLRAGKDVVVHAPTGAGKTLVFELWSNHGKTHRQAVYTVPTRALANDKLAEWRAKGWNVGIATGDLSENLGAPVVVATLETQKSRLIQGEGPSLLVVDEYQMLGDTDRGLNYELALALAPATTQLLLLSGSVANPQEIVKWLHRLGRKAVLVRQDLRPVPLEEVMVDHLHYHLPGEIRGYWPRFVAKALAEDLGPILLFAPRRAGAESIASEIARQLPNPNPLELSEEQRKLLDDRLAEMVRCRVAYHHSGLSYGARAGIIEPLAKAGQLRVVVATMGLAAGINFSLRSVALAGESYRRDGVELPLKSDEILQMFGRAGRRGIDETGYVLVGANGVRQHEGSASHLSRSAMVDWSALLGLMQAAVEQGRDPLADAIRAQQRLFTTKPILLGVEESLKNPNAPCGFMTDAERARHVRKRFKQILNSAGEWESPAPPGEAPASEAFLITRAREPFAPEAGKAPPFESSGSPANEGPPVLRPLLSDPEALEVLGLGPARPLPPPASDQQSGRRYGRLVVLGDALEDGRIVLAKGLRRLLDWDQRTVSEEVWNSKVLPAYRERMTREKTPLEWVRRKGGQIQGLLRLDWTPVQARIDGRGVALIHPPTREVRPKECDSCSLLPACSELPPTAGVAFSWRRLGLVDGKGAPTRRGIVVSFFSQSNGLAIAAGLEDDRYLVEDLAYDLANLDAGFRFCGEENRWGGRLAEACRRAYGMHSIPGILENGVPPDYGSGAEQIAASVHRNPASKHEWINDLLGDGDIDRAIIEWRSLLRQIVHAPRRDWPRWTALKSVAGSLLNETRSPTLSALPPLPYNQTRRAEHRLHLRR